MEGITVIGDQDITEWFYIKQPFLVGFPTKLLSTILLQFNEIHLVEKWGK